MSTKKRPNYMVAMFPLSVIAGVSGNLIMNNGGLEQKIIGTTIMLAVPPLAGYLGLLDGSVRVNNRRASELAAFSVAGFMSSVYVAAGYAAAYVFIR